MSSPMNNNLPVQASSITSDFANTTRQSSSTTSALRPQQRAQQNDHPQQSNRGRRGRLGRGGRGGRGGLTNRLSIFDATGKSSLRHASDTDDQLANNIGTSHVQSAADITINAGNHSRGNRSNRGGSGKYRQRHQMNQLIDGMDGLDIDLVESIVPTTSTTRPSEGNRNRHATNSRKVNLTHLLNYKYDRKQPRLGGPRVNSGNDSDNPRLHSRNHLHQYRDHSSVHKFSKQQFLQANCQFVVLGGHDYSVHKVDPDWPVDWDFIEEVKFRQTASTETTCPICLEPPVAAKITRCGHIYCWTCMLHYLSLSDENCRQCPICFEAVYRSDLRSVVSESYSNHAVEENIVMKLMVRRKGCLEVVPYEGTAQDQTQSEQDTEAAHYASQANLLIIDPNVVINNIIEREKAELLWKKDLDRDEPEICFVDQALKSLENRTERLRSIPAVKAEPKVQIQSENNSEKSFLFYQSIDGQHIYLNPFSTKILCHEYSCLEECPREISAKILQMDWVSMNEAWRKRFKYLEHLPLTCEFRLIEIDFEKNQLVSKETYKHFEDQIRARAKERDRRRRDERKREKIIQVEQNRKIYGIQPSLKINLDNFEQFPSVSDERYLGLTKSRNYGSNNNDDENSSSEDGDITEPPSRTGNQVPSVDQDQPQEVVMANSPLSFKDIQLQEEAKLAKANSDQNRSVWVNSRDKKGQPSSSSQACSSNISSFAQLLVGAKTSQKEWTKSHAASSRTAFPTVDSNSGQINRRSINSTMMTRADENDNDEEDLRAPPSEFTISDFLDLNVVSSGKRKGKGTKVGNKKC